MRSTLSRIDIRPYQDDDESQVLALLNTSLGGGPMGEWSSELFHWKHLTSPFGRSFMLVAEKDGQIIALRAFMRWRLQTGNGRVEGLRPVDSVTHPDFRRLGVFSRLTREAMEAVRGEADLVFNTPNEKSLPGYLKMGWSIVGQIPLSIRIRRPIRVATRRRSLKRPGGEAMSPSLVDAETASDMLRDDKGVLALLADSSVRDSRLATYQSLSYLRWRYGTAPLDYLATGAYEGDRLAGVAVFRVRARGELWQTTIAQMILRPDDRHTAGALLRRALRAAPVDYASCYFPGRSAAARAALRAGFIRTPGTTTLVVNPLRSGFKPDPTDIDSWALSLGDIEVF